MRKGESFRSCLSEGNAVGTTLSDITRKAVTEEVSPEPVVMESRLERAEF